MNLRTNPFTDDIYISCDTYKSNGPKCTIRTEVFTSYLVGVKHTHRLGIDVIFLRRVSYNLL